jgi:hypothetical protein
MSINRIQQRLTVETSKKSSNTDTFIKINLDGKEKLLPPGEIEKIVDVGERFDLERQNSKIYRILGTINSNSSNPLFNLDSPTGINTWKGLNDILFLDKSFPKNNNVTDLNDISYNESYKNNLLEIDGWFGYREPDKSKGGSCNFYDMEPTRERFSFLQDIKPYGGKLGDGPVKNWDLTITYPYKKDSNHSMVNGGLLLLNATPSLVSTKEMTAFGVGCLHNLNIGDTVKITGTNDYDGTHTVVRLGLDNGDLKDYYFVIELPISGSVSTNSRMKRVVNGFESDYYFRIFKKIKTINKPIIEKDDCDVYKLAFSENVFNDDIVQFVFNEDIDITGLVDNLDRPLSELYLTRVKTSSNGLFTRVSSGIETPYIQDLKDSKIKLHLRDIPAINLIHNGGNNQNSLPFPTHNPLEYKVDMDINNEFYGDLVEYNKIEVQEIILADVSHRFNTKNRETETNFSYYRTVGFNPTTETINLGPRQEGYFYKAHQLIRIRDFSPYVELGDSSTVGIPSYAVKLDDGRYLWRDLLSIGYNQSDEKALDYPFLNGSHYMHLNDCFYVRRQDAFNDWGLYYNEFPADPYGERITDKYTINSEDEVC